MSKAACQSDAGGVVGIVPAAGQSRRMGQAKQILEVGGRPMVRHVVEAMLAGGASGVVVVVPPALLPVVDFPSEVNVVVNDDPQSGMIDSIRIAVRVVLDKFGGEARVGLAICPGDAGGVIAPDVRRCIAAFREAPDRIVVAGHGDRRGHPLILPASLAAAVLSPECDGGLHHLVRNRPHLRRMVQCSAGVVSNINTPDDYRGLG